MKKLRSFAYLTVLVMISFFLLGCDGASSTTTNITTDNTEITVVSSDIEITSEETTVTSQTTITETYTINQYTVEYVDDNGTVLQTADYDFGADLSEVTAPTDPTREGYTFDGWDTTIPETMPAEHVTVTATYTINQYTVEYMDYNGTVLQTADYDFGGDLSEVTAPTDPTREGYTFDGWDTTIPETMPAEHVTVTATYTINQYTVEYMDYNGTVLQTADYDFGADLSEVTAPADLSREGYTFDGWDTTIPETMPAENIQLHANWIINQYKIIFTAYENYDPLYDIALAFGENIILVSLGSSSSSAISSEGRIFTWGDNGYGQLGDGTTNPKNKPVDITNQFNLDEGETIISLSLGEDYSSALTSKGRIFTWGYNGSGQLGDGTTTDSSTPIDITHQFNLDDGETLVLVSLDGYHSSAISSEGRVFTWGVNRNGQLGDGTTTDSSTPIDITHQFNLDDGETIVSISLGKLHSSVITSEGRLFTWGYNGSGQLGDGTTYLRKTPVDITNQFNLNTTETLVLVSLDGYRSSAISSEGRVFTWGNNHFGQLGDGTTTNSYTPKDILNQFNLNDGETIILVSYSSALTSEGRVFTWGNNHSGQLGDGTVIDKYTPIDITSQFDLDDGEVIVSVSSIYDNASAISSEGRIFTWGSNDFGQLGDGTYTNSLVPILPIMNHCNIIDVKTYNYNDHVLDFTPTNEGYIFDGWYTDYDLTTRYNYTTMPASDISLYARWKINQYTITFESNGGNTIESLTQDYNTVVLEPNRPTKEGYTFDGWYVDSDFKTSYSFTTMPAENIQLYAKWIVNQYTIIYLDYEDYNPLNDIPLYPGEIVASVTLGFYNSSAITTEGRIFIWGSNVYGRLGDGTTTNSYTPTDITSHFNLKDGESIDSISLGRSHSSAITTEGRIFTWGSNHYGQLGDSTTIDRYTPTDITSYFNLNDGEGIIAVSLGFFHSSAVTSEGRIFMWGDNRNGQIGYGFTSSSFTPIDITSGFNLNDGETILSVSLGNSFSTAISSEGRIFTWGSNDYGRLGDGTTTNSYTPKDITSLFNLDDGEIIVSVSSGHENSSAISSEGRVYTWGRNHIGQLGDGTTVDKYSPTNITNYFNLNDGETIVSVSLGWIHSSAISSEGRIFTWGYNGYGQLGDGTTTDKLFPTNITNQFDLNNGDSIQSVKLGYTHSSVYTLEGKVFIWGHNYVGQIGDGTIIDNSVPNKINFLSGYSIDEIVYDYNDDIFDLNPTREGYTFDGWYLDSTMTNRFDLSKMPAEELVVYGRWLKN